MLEIINESSLLKLGLSFIKVEKIHLGSYVQLHGDINSFIDYCRSQNIYTAFYKYEYYNKDDYVITEELLYECTGDSYERDFCRPWIEKHNKALNSYNFDNPCGLALCTATSAFSVVMYNQNLWFQAKKAEDALQSYLDDNAEKLIDYYEEEEGSSSIEELRGILLSDKDFRFCSTKETRNEYMKRFMQKKENKKFWALVRGAKNEADRRFKLNVIIHQIYNEYRNQCYNLKIRVGEELLDDE